MSTILTAYNLAGGATQSSTLTNVKNIRIQAMSGHQQDTQQGGGSYKRVLFEPSFDLKI